MHVGATQQVTATAVRRRGGSEAWLSRVRSAFHSWRRDFLRHQEQLFAAGESPRRRLVRGRTRGNCSRFHQCFRLRFCSQWSLVLALAAASSNGMPSSISAHEDCTYVLSM